MVPILASSSAAFRVIGSSKGWARWDAAPRFVGGEERSLDGGLRYSIETGSYAELRDQFMWVPSPPSESAFAAAIARAFESWTIVDPETGLPAAFHFVEDLATPAIDDPGDPGHPDGFAGLNPGAEIDVFAATPHAGPGFAASVRFFVDATRDDLTLTSGSVDYAGRAITGADIRINPGFVWSLTGFEVLLTHEIGHALGLADLEAATTPGSVSGFLDDDYDGSSDATALATLGNSFALAIDPLDPDASGLQVFSSSLNSTTPGVHKPGLDSPGVELLMESEGIFDLLATDPLLQNDEFAGRQFLYPVQVPEPGAGGMLWLGAIGLAAWARHRLARREGFVATRPLRVGPVDRNRPLRVGPVDRNRLS